MFKRLTCDHHYKHYHTDEYMQFLTTDFLTQWHYVCTKCGKKNKIMDGALREFLKDTRKKVAMEIVKGEDHSEYEDFKFPIGDYVLSGKVAFYTHKRLKHFYQDNPIIRY